MGVSSVSRATALSSGAAAFGGPHNTAGKDTKTSSRDAAFFSEYAYEAERSAKTADMKTSEEQESGKSISELIREQTEKIDKLFSSKENDGDKEKQLMSIRMKMRGGLVLSTSEEQYLSKHDPDAYSNYRTMQDARRSFRMQLMCCRTKDEVNGMRLANALSAMSAYKKAIRHGGDGTEIAGLNMALEREISGFSQSSRYRDLPTAAERDKYYTELSKARKFEREKRLVDKQNATRKKKKQVKQPGDGKRTVAQVNNSALGKKVRKANRVGVCGACYAPSAVRSYLKMDQKG